MPIQVKGKLIKLQESCPVEDAETLHEKLLERPEADLDLSACQHLHSAVLQVLLQQPRPVRKPPADVFLNTVVLPSLQAARAAASAEPPADGANE